MEEEMKMENVEEIVSVENCGEPAGKALRDAVFSSNVVWRTLGKCLNFSDLKACRLVCKNFNEKVMDETGFISRTRVNLRESDLLKPQGFRTTEHKWKSLSLPIITARGERERKKVWSRAAEELGVELPDEYKSELSGNATESSDMSWLYPKMDEVEHLTLRKYVGNHEDDPLPPYFEGVLKASKKLRSLSVEAEFLSCTVVQSCQGTLKRISELEIVGWFGGADCADYFISYNKYYKALAATATNLSVIKVRKNCLVDFDDDYGGEKERMMRNMAAIFGIMKNNQSHLEVLELDDMAFWSKPPNPASYCIVNQVFPALKKVKIRAWQDDGEKLKTFFRAQPPLEEIDITVLNQFPNDLVKVIGEKGEGLKKLTIKTKGFTEKEVGMWKFLSSLSLQSFSLKFWKSRRFSPNCEAASFFLRNLPSTITSIELKGLPDPGDLSSSLLTLTDFVSIKSAILTVLRLKRCGAIVTDETVEFICRNLKMLQELKLYNADDRVTDYGFTGLRPGSTASSEFSISDLRGLKCLKLRSCGAITDETLKRGIRFLELRVLDISYNRNLTAEGYKEVLKQNPSLEEFIASKVDNDMSPKEQNTICPRLPSCSKRRSPMQEAGMYIDDSDESYDSDVDN